MIVRDEEENLSHCLESVRGLFDEIVVVDTGSVDRTKEIARAFGARVFDFVWIDDFAAARNEALAHATGDYAFWLDADDVVEPAENEKLNRLLQNLRAGDEAGYVVRCACDPGPMGRGARRSSIMSGSFRFGRACRWTYRVHEQILPSLKRAKIPVRWTDLIVTHTGYVDAAVRGSQARSQHQDPQARAGRTARRSVCAVQPGHERRRAARMARGARVPERSLAGSAPTDSIVRKIYALIARVHQIMGNLQEALRTCARGSGPRPRGRRVVASQGGIASAPGESAEAEQCWRRILG